MTNMLASRVTLAATLAAPAFAQTSPPPSHWEAAYVRSGVHQNGSPVEGVVFRDFVTMPANTPWLRLCFGKTWLGKGSYLRIVSLRDGDVMTMRQEHLEQWGWSSAYFNGNAVMIELVAGPGTQKNYVAIDRVLAGDVNPVVLPPQSICGRDDDRAPAVQSAKGRIGPIGCTGWIIDAGGVTDKLHLSAGHCFGNGVLEFDVPSSNGDCSITHPPASRQFAIDTSTSQQVNGGVGNDFWVFRCFPNPTTGMTTYQTQRAAFGLATTIPGVGATLRDFGFGVDGTDAGNSGVGNESCSCSNRFGTRNQTLQTDTGPLIGNNITFLSYGIDTCGGNSGSVVVDDTSGLAVAIHTHGGCTLSGGSNAGTAVMHPALQAAITSMSGGSGVTNDECAGARPVSGGTNGPFSNIGATTSFVFPCVSASAGNDVWFSYVATCTGNTTFDTCSATRTIDTVMEVFSGNCGSLTSLFCNDDACGFGSSVTVSLTAGQTCFIRVAGYNFVQGAFDLTVTTCGLADECAAAIPLSIGVNGPFTNAGATSSLPGFACIDGRNDVWFTFEAPAYVAVTFSTCHPASNFDTVLEVFRGSCAALTSVGCNDDFCDVRSSVTTTTASGWTRFYVRVGGYRGLTGQFALVLTHTPVNDECAGAIPVVDGYVGPLSTFNATTSLPWPCANGGADVWLAYTPPITGVLTVTSCTPAGSYDTAIEVLAGSCGSLTSLGCNDDTGGSCGLGSTLAVPVIAGQSCFIRLGGNSSAQGEAFLLLFTRPANDECANAIALVDGTNGPFSNVSATPSVLNSSCGAVGPDVWFRYTASCTCPHTFSTCTPVRSFDTVMELYDGSCAAPVSIGCNDNHGGSCGNGSQITANLVQGQTYLLRVAGRLVFSGSFEVTAEPGSGTGSFAMVQTQCGPLRINVSGQPRIGGTLNADITRFNGVPFIGCGFGAPSPFCGPCAIGHGWESATFGSVRSVTIPAASFYIGQQVGIQGADFLGTGGCASPSIGLSETVVVTIG